MLLWLLSLALGGALDDALAELVAAGEADVGIGVVRWHDQPRAYAGAANNARPFEVGSTSKPYTGLVLADAALRGEVVLDDPIRMPPGIRFLDGPAPTYRQLATHTAGLDKRPPNQVDDHRSEDYSLTDLWAAVGMTRRGPRVYSYSNYGIGLLGESLGLEAGGPYPARLQARVLGPLGMLHTGFLDVPPGRRRNGKVADPWYYEGLRGAGSIDSTVPDEQRWLSAWLDPDSTPIADALRLATDVHFRRDEDQSVGLAWRRREEGGRVIYQHTGSTSGFSSYIAFEVHHGVGVVVHRARLDTDLVEEVGKKLLDRLIAGPGNHLHAKALASFERHTDAVLTHHGKLVSAPDLTRMPIHHSPHIRGLWVALATLRVVHLQQLTLDEPLGEGTVGDHLRRAWTSGIEGPEDPLWKRLEECTGRPLDELVRAELAGSLQVPPSVVPGLRQRDLARIGELLHRGAQLQVLGDRASQLPPLPSGAAWHDPASRLSLWFGPDQLVAAVAEGQPAPKMAERLKKLVSLQ